MFSVREQVGVIFSVREQVGVMFTVSFWLPQPAGRPWLPSTAGSVSPFVFVSRVAHDSTHYQQIC